jgi:hypothetical protein
MYEQKPCLRFPHKGATAVITTCSLTSGRRRRDVRHLLGFPSRGRSWKPGGMAGSFAVRHVRVRCGFHRGHGWASVLATESPSIHRRGSQDAVPVGLPNLASMGVRRRSRGRQRHVTQQNRGRGGATISGRATAAEVSIDRQIDPQDRFANGVIPQVLPPQSGSFCHRRWSFSTPSRAADTAREGHSGSGESDLGDMDSYA